MNAALDVDGRQTDVIDGLDARFLRTARAAADQGHEGDRARCRELSPTQCSAGIHSCTRLVMPLSAMILAPVTRLAAGLDTKTITRAISSTVPMRPHGICFKAQS